MLEIKQSQNGFYIGDEANPVAQITYLKRGNDVIVANHTYVHESLRGQNIARQLLAKLVEFARMENKKIIPVCSFVVAEFQRNPSYADVIYK